MENKNILFIDKFGRTILGEVINENEKTLKIKNPGIIHISQDAQTHRFNFQVLPMVLFELIDVENTKECNLIIEKDNISIIMNENDEPIIPNKIFVQQRDNIFNALAKGLKNQTPMTEQPDNSKILEVK